MALRSLRIGGVAFRWESAVTVLLRGKNGEVAQDVQRRAYAVQKRAKRAAPYRYGTLRRGIKVESVRESPIGPYSTVTSTAKHTWYVIAGRPEVTRGLDQVVYSGEYRDSLKFFPKRGSREPIFRNKVKAVKPNQFMENSIDAALD